MDFYPFLLGFYHEIKIDYENIIVGTAITVSVILRTSRAGDYGEKYVGIFYERRSCFFFFVLCCNDNGMMITSHSRIKLMTMCTAKKCHVKNYLV